MNRLIPAAVMAASLAFGAAYGQDDILYPRHDQRSGTIQDIPLDRACLDAAGQPVAGDWLLLAPHRDPIDWEQAQTLAAAHCVLRRLYAIEQALAVLLQRGGGDE